MTDIDANQIREFIQTKLLGGQRVETGEDLLLSGLLDSLGVMSLVAHIEQTRGARIPPEDVTLENFSSIDAMIGYLNRA
jgi:acyl carrier protein